MNIANIHSQLTFSRKFLLTIGVLIILTASCLVGTVSASNIHKQRLQGTVKSANVGLPGYKVTLYASHVGPLPFWQELGTDISDGSGNFEIYYRSSRWLSRWDQPVLFVLAEDGLVMLASAIGETPKTDGVVINEITTVATGVAFAQFVNERKVRGNKYGMSNAVHMAANMANPETGEVGEVLFMKPNGMETSTFPTFNSMANMVASCVVNDNNCDTLFDATTLLGKPRPSTVLQAVANMTKYPFNGINELFGLSFVEPVYSPALALGEEPTSWLLFLKFTGGFYKEQDRHNLMNGPGNIAIDKRGFAWINDNYVPRKPAVPACAGLRLMKFYPWGKRFPGSPYFGGGLSGVGFGITLDPRGNIWLGNFGFEATECMDGTIPPIPSKMIPAIHNTVSVFHPNGSPLSPADGFAYGDISWPQATVSDKKGNIWIANCGNDSVTKIPRGKPHRAHNILLPGAKKDPFDPAAIKPFAIAIDHKGWAWVTGNQAGWNSMKGDPAGLVYRISPSGAVETLPNPIGDDMKPYITWPMGIAADSKGNMWVSNSDDVRVPCITDIDPQGGGKPSVALYLANGEPYSNAPFTGGDPTIPWGLAVDGNDTVWVFNFGHPPHAPENSMEFPDTGITHLCGMDTAKCPPGSNTVGAPISPSGGYSSNALERITGGNIDPSGNLWLMNNWKKAAPVDLQNPGGNSFVIVPGAAGPIKTPLIGPPQSFHVVPGTPDVSILINGLDVALNWDTVIGASGYKLYYAPYPYTGPESIVSLDLGNKNNFSAELWKGAAYYVAISAYNSVGESGYSNIEQFNLK